MADTFNHIISEVMARLKLTLYIAGRSAIAERAIQNLDKICEEHFPGQYDLTIVDVLLAPELIERVNIIATPTLIKEKPQPPCRLIGDFSVAHDVLSRLNHPPPSAKKKAES